MRQTSYALTQKSSGRARALVTVIAITPPDVFNQQYDTRAIWDTGASGTVITQKVVDALGLQPTGFAKINTASQKNIDSPTFLINVVLQSGQRRRWR